MSPLHRTRKLLPGIALSAGIALAAYLAEYAEVTLFGGSWIEGLVLAIGMGIAVCTIRPSPPWLRSGIEFSAKTLLELAIVLLGASISLPAILGAGRGLIAGIACVVLVSIIASYAVGRLFGLAPKLAMLIACGNSICGNSAIVAVAPLIKAESEEVAAALAFTAVLGVLAVFLLPVLYFKAGMSGPQYGVLAGLTVYAVPQVLAATAPAGLLSVQTGTLVKLVRVLMLAPVMFLLGIAMKSETAGKGGRSRHMRAPIPWFIAGFFAMALLRSSGLLPNIAVAAMATVSNMLTVVAMAALGLSVNIRTVAHAGGRVIFAASLSLVVLGAISLALIALLGIA